MNQNSHVLLQGLGIRVKLPQNIRAKDQLLEYRDVSFTCKCKIRSLRSMTIYLYVLNLRPYMIYFGKIFCGKDVKLLAPFQENCDCNEQI